MRMKCMLLREKTIRKRGRRNGGKLRREMVDYDELIEYYSHSNRKYCAKRREDESIVVEDE